MSKKNLKKKIKCENKYLWGMIEGSCGFSSIGTGCCKSLNLEGFPRILGFRAASATATTNGIDLSWTRFIVGGGLILFWISSKTFGSTGLKIILNEYLNTLISGL